MQTINPDDRIAFLDEIRVMEVDFSDLTFATAAEVTRMYDAIEHRIEPTAKRWYFMVNYRDCRIMPEAWGQFAHRGKNLNLAWSLGTVRYDASARTREEIMAKSKTDNFDPNLFASREDALAELEKRRTNRFAA